MSLLQAGRDGEWLNVAGSHHGIQRTDAGRDHVSVVDVNRIVADEASSIELNRAIRLHAILSPTAMVAAGARRGAAVRCIGQQHEVALSEIFRKGMFSILDVAKRVAVIPEHSLAIALQFLGGLSCEDFAGSRNPSDGIITG